MNYYQPNYQQNFQNYQPNYQQNMMPIPTEEDALKYPIAPGNSIMFKIENQPLIIEKTMGLSQLDTPTIRYIDLVPRETNKVEYATKEDIEQLREEIKSMRRPARKKEAEDE
jgi:hypothetical protein